MVYQSNQSGSIDIFNTFESSSAQLYIERETCVLTKGFEPKSFPLKFNPPTFEYKIHYVEVDLYYFKYL